MATTVLMVRMSDKKMSMFEHKKQSLAYQNLTRGALLFVFSS